MQSTHLSFELNSPDDTATFARLIGSALCPGDCILLEGHIGAGKTHFARSLIQSLQDQPEDVPSPTFTLVQTYPCPLGEIWHADLYRLTHPDEVEELGLMDAIETAITLIEWPDRLGELAPQTALTMSLTADPDNPERRQVALRWTEPAWEKLNSILSEFIHG